MSILGCFTGMSLDCSGMPIWQEKGRTIRGDRHTSSSDSQSNHVRTNNLRRGPRHPARHLL